METTNIQIRGVPIEIRERVRRRARKEGRSMSDYLLALIERDLSVPSPAEFRRRLARLSAVVLDRPAARDIEEIRGGRDVELDTRHRSKARKSG
ncbi:MAG: Arc family DNA-binding protein [Actinomycetota bacterium]|nr:Arc family DNA-binding protein [Actinomycetota bacterium]